MLYFKSVTNTRHHSEMSLKALNVRKTNEKKKYDIELRSEIDYSQLNFSGTF
jgi:hypothetical protein